MRFFTFLFFLALSGAPTLSAQLNPLQSGYDLLVDNRAEEARDYFSGRLTGPFAGDAALALCLAETMLHHAEAALAAYHRFATLETDAAKRNAFLDAFWQVQSRELGKESYAYHEAQVDNPYTRMRPLALYTLAEHHHLKGELRKSRELYGRIGTVQPWSIVGPFENISESGFDRDFGVPGHPERDARFINKRGVAVSWIPLERPGRSGWLHFGNYLNAEDAIVYAQSYCQSPGDREAVFRLGTSGSVKVWVNDRLAFSEVHERDNHLDTYVFRAPLQAGHNRVLIQIGASGDGGANFQLRLTDEAGNSLSDLDWTNEPGNYTVGPDRAPDVMANPTEAWFRARIAGGQSTIVDLLAFSQFYLLNGFHEEARAILAKARTDYPSNLQVITQMIPVLRALEDETGASEIEQQLVQEHPDYSLSLLSRLSDAKDLEDWPRCDELIAQYRHRYGDSETLLKQEIFVTANRGETDKTAALIQLGMARYPESTDFLLGQAHFESSVRNRPANAIRLLEKYLKDHYREGVVEQLIDLNYKAGNAQEVIKLFQNLLEWDPDNINYLSRLSRLYSVSGNARESQRTLDRALALAPYRGSLHSTQGQFYAEAGDQVRAEAAYEKALALNPYDYDSRDALRNLRSESTSAFSALPETDYYALYTESKGTEAYPDDNSVILAYDVQQVIHEGGASEVRTSLLVKALTPAGVDEWKEYSIPVYGDQQGVVEKVEVLDPDGSRHEASRSGTDVVFDRLQPGGAVHVVFRLREFQQGRLSGKFWNDHALSTGLPSVQSTYSLLAPKGTDFDVRITGLQEDTVEPVRTPLDGRELYVWQLTDRPSLQPEAVTPNISDIVTTVRVSNIKDWAFIARWYSELTHAKIRVDADVRQAVDELFADAPADLSRREQVERIYRFVSGNIRYISVPFLQSNFIPQSAARTLATRQGDCKDVSSLFVAMCDARGITANLVLINTRDRSRESLALPGIGFNHCIARVELDGVPYFVELTDENLPFGTGDWSVNNSFALVIPREGEAYTHPAGLINPESRGVNSVIRTGTLSFDGADMVFDLQNRRVNSVASSFRHTYRDESPDNQRRSMQQAIADNYPRVTLTDLSFSSGLDDLFDNEVAYAYAYRVSDPGNKIGGMKIYPVVLSDQLQTPPYTSTAERQLPIDLWQTFEAEYYEQTLEVITPEGKALVEVPEPVTVSNDYVDYGLEYAATESGLTIRRTIRLKQDIVPPAAYASFRDDMLRIVEADKVNLAYR